MSSSKPIKVSTNENNACIHELIEWDQRITVLQISKELSYCDEYAQPISLALVLTQDCN